MRVDYITHMGDDLMVVDAARVSFDKKSEWFQMMPPAPTIEQWEEASRTGIYPPGQRLEDGLKVLNNADTKLIRYLAKHNHWSPFSHPQIQVRVTAPIFIANQLKRHTVGLSLNEVSRRYVDDEPTFYIPDKWRERPPGNIKQGSSDEEIKDSGVSPDGTFTIYYEEFINLAKEYYTNMIEEGVAPEMARMILPQSMNTSWIWTGSLLAFIRIYKLRIDSHAQLESQIIAKQIGEILEKHFPVSFKAWTTES